MSKKKIVLCDADDTIENLLDAWVGYLNGRYGTNVKSDDVVDWNVSLFFPELTPEQVYEPIYDKEFWKLITPIEGCYSVLERLNNEYELYIVTATNYQTCDTKIEKILELYPFLKWSQFVIASNKHLVRGDVLIDDGTHNLVDFPAERILFTRPHNKDFQAEKHNMIRVDTWDEIYSAVTATIGGIQ